MVYFFNKINLNIILSKSVHIILILDDIFVSV